MQRMHFGTTSAGIPIHVFHLESSAGVSVRVMELGAAVVSIEIPDREGRPGPIVPGFDSLAPYLESTHPRSAILGRYAGQVGDDSLPPGLEMQTLDEQKVPYKLHKNASGLHNMVWWGEALGEGVRFHYSSPEGEGGYPGKLECTVEYRLDQTGSLRVTQGATSDVRTVVDLASQIHFNLRDGGRSSVLDHELSIFAEEIVEVDREGIPTGHFLTVEGSALDFRSPRTIGGASWESSRPRGDYDDCYVLRRSNSSIRTVALLREPRSGRNLELATSQPGLRFGTSTTPGSGPDQGRQSLCLCPQNYPGAAYQHHFPSPELAPGTYYDQTTIYRFWNES